MATQDEYIKTALRLPRGLHRSIQESAEKRGRSMNAEIISRLDRSFALSDSQEQVRDPLDTTGFLVLTLGMILRDKEVAGIDPTIRSMAEQMVNKLSKNLAFSSEADGSLFSKKDPDDDF